MTFQSVSLTAELCRESVPRKVEHYPNLPLFTFDPPGWWELHGILSSDKFCNSYQSK